MSRLANNTPILPGEERALGISRGFYTGDRAQLLSYSLLAVLFTDGTFTGPEDLRQAFSKQLSELRSLARDTQYRADKYRLMETERNSARDRGIVNSRVVLAHVLLVIREDKGEDEAEAALARIAALPDVKRGEQQ